MKQNVELYINGKRVDFSTTPDVFYSYKVTDLTNPTAIKNSYSKSITIPGTPSNNDLFGHIWNVERTQSEVNFNASKKAEFQLFVNGNLYESGYVRLYEATITDKQIYYSITLYGGLGDFFANLTYDENGNELNLNNLRFRLNDSSVNSENEFDFNISKETIYDAWIGSSPTATTGLWKYINFAPCYNGIPEDFDADKVLINFEGSPLPETWVDEEAKPEDPSIYVSKAGYSIGEIMEDLDEWATRDLRSYLQRPVIRVKEIINAICAPENNGGYQVELDSDFFNSNNPYYNDSWLTLPMMKDLQYDETSEVYSDATLMCGDALVQENYDTYAPLSFAVGSFSQDTMGNMSVTGQIIVKPLISVSANTLYTSYIEFGSTGLFGNNIAVRNTFRGALFCQLYAYNGDNVVGYSDAYMLQNRIYESKLGDYWTISNSSLENPYPLSSTSLYGNFQKESGNRYKFVQENGAQSITFTIKNINTNVTSLQMRFYWGATPAKHERCQEYAALFFKDINYKTESGFGYVVMSSATMNVTDKSFGAVMQGGGKTGQRITKKLLLGNTDTPAAYITSFAKMFGLYFLKDMNEKKIQILTRNNFYNNPNYKDLTKFIDRSKDVTVNPLTFDAKYYDFKLEMDETAYSKKYQSAYNVPYGCEIVNTGYDFGAEHSEVLDNVVFRGGIEALNKNKYYTMIATDNYYKSYMLLGFKYVLWAADEEHEIEFTGLGGTRRNTIYGINDDQNLKYYDVYPKPVFCDKSNKGVDGTNVLLFFNGYKSVTSGRTRPLEYYLTDDTPYMSMLNEGQSCWIYTNSEYDRDGNRIGIKLDKLPVFERYVTDENSGFITMSMDFGSPRELYIPSYTHLENATVYDHFWKTYIEDLYSVNGRVLDCYVRLIEKPNPEWMRAFFWFDNAIWRLNEIEDWSVAEDVVTHMQFVKVQDTNNYTSVQPNKGSRITFVLSKYLVDASGETITGTITCPAGTRWHIEWPSAISCSPISGTGSGSVTITIPRNPNTDTRRSFNISVVATGMQARATVEQKYEGEGAFIISPRDLIVPFSGGTYELDVEWTDKGDNELNAFVEKNNGAGYLSYAVDTQTKKVQDKVIIVVPPYSGTNVITNYAKFTCSPSNGEYTIGIAQLPEEVNYIQTGETKTFDFEYISQITIGTKPFWLNTDYSGITLTTEAINNTREDREGPVEVQGNGSSATFLAKQGAGGKLVPNVLNYECSGGTQLVNCYITGDWQVVGYPEWTEINPRTGNGNGLINVTAQPNTGGTRTGSLVVHSYSDKVAYVVNVSQIGCNSERLLTVTPATQEVPASGGYYTVEVEYINRNGDIVIVTKEGDDELITWLPESLVWNEEHSTLNVTIGPNTGTSQLTHTLYYTGTGASATQVFTQAGVGKSATVDESPMGFVQSGETKPNGINSNVAWTAVTEQDWISFTPTSGDSGYTGINVTTTPNTSPVARTGYIYVKEIGTDELLATIVVNQAAMEEILEVEPLLLTFEKTGGSLTFSVTSNTNWTITKRIDSNDFVTTSVESGAGNAVVTVSVGPSDSLTTLTEGLIVSTITKSKVVEVKQQPRNKKHISVRPTRLVFEMRPELESGPKRVIVLSNAEWVISSYPDWIVPSATGDTGQLTIDVTALLNRGEYRTGEMRFETEDEYVILVVEQKAYSPWLDVAPQSIEHNFSGDTTLITVDSSSEWEARLKEEIIGTNPVEEFLLNFTVLHYHIPTGTTSEDIQEELGETSTPSQAVQSYIIANGVSCGREVPDWLFEHPCDYDELPADIELWVKTSNDATLTYDDIPFKKYLTEIRFANNVATLDTHLLEKEEIVGGEFVYVNKAPNLANVVLNGVQEIGRYAFENSPSLSAVTGNDNLEYIYPYAFNGCSALTGFTFNEGLHIVQVGAFNDCTLLSGSIVFPSTLEYLGCSPTEPGSGTSNNVIFNNCTGITDVTFLRTGRLLLGPGCMAGMSGLRKITLNDIYIATTTEFFRTGAGRYYASNVEELDYSNTSADIVPVSAFTRGNTYLSSIKLPVSLEVIGNYAFDNVNALGTVVIPANVRSIGAYNFHNCATLSSIFFMPKTAPTMGSNCFQNLNATGVLHYPSGSDYTTIINLLPSGWTAVGDL